MRCLAALVGALVFCSVSMGASYEYTYYPPGSVYAGGLEPPGPFPEHQGWERNDGYGTVQREITAEAEFKLSAEEYGDWDTYVWYMEAQEFPDEGEYLYVQWRVAVDDDYGWDTSMSIALTEVWGDITLAMDVDNIRDAEGGEWYYYPEHQHGDAHTFLVRTVNLVDYDLFVDGQYAFSDVFKLPSILGAWVDWGDLTTGWSTSRWAFFRFGVTPLGDIHIDGHVNLMDFATFAMCYSPGSTEPPPGCSDLEFALSDLDNDGDVDLSDFGVFALNYGS